MYSCSQFKQQHLLIVLVLFLLQSANLYSQLRHIKGFVKNNFDQAIEDVLIISPDSSYSATTDVDGVFSIKIPLEVDKLFFLKSGYQGKQVDIISDSYLQVVLIIAAIEDLSLEDLLQTNVRTVSMLEQNINKAPGVVTIITREDLQHLGARTIREALSFVPGFNQMQNDDEQIFAVRGIFATTNQKILLMRDGHSLNEANLDIPQTDYSLSIANIEKIEVIRGPGASIYGNSALAAVVNIITTNKDQGCIQIGAGNYGQRNLDACINTNYGTENEFMVFARYASTAGQEFQVPVIVSKDLAPMKGTYKTFEYPGNFDIGAKFKKQWISTSLNVRRHDYKTYWSAQGFYTNTDSLLYTLGLKQNSFHYDLSITPIKREKISVILSNSLYNY